METVPHKEERGHHFHNQERMDCSYQLADNP